jgi:acetylornithine aminotransferase
MLPASSNQFKVLVVSIKARLIFFKLEKVCKANDVVLILDEVQSGFGRKFFAHQYHDIKPDIICMAKGMGNGFQ